MDNVTHTLIGATFARALPRRLQRPEIYWASVIGNNMPDSDFLMKFFPGTTDLDYLIHHRGYTHTFLLAPLMGYVAAFAAQKITRTPRMTRELLLLGIIGSLFHVGADFMNGYGVHPLSPFSNRWFYGDAVFIVEPLIWFILVPFVAERADRIWAKVAWWALGFGMFLLVWNHSTVDQESAIILSALFGSCVALYKLVQESRKKVALVCALFMITVGSFFTGGALARSKVREAWANEKTPEIWSDITSSPLPGNPFCWGTWSATKTETHYIYRSSVVSLFPSLKSVQECGRTFNINGSAEYFSIPFENSSFIEWRKGVTLSISERDEFRSKSMSFRKLESFARFLYIRKNQDGSVIAGDLRYDRSEGIDFADAFIPANENPSNEKGPWDIPLDRHLEIN